MFLINKSEISDEFTSMVNGYTGLFITKLDILDVCFFYILAYRRNAKRLENIPSITDELANVEV